MCLWLLIHEPWNTYFFVLFWNSSPEVPWISWLVWRKSGAQSPISEPFSLAQSDTLQSTETEARFLLGKWFIWMYWEKDLDLDLDRSLTGQSEKLRTQKSSFSFYFLFWTSELFFKSPLSDTVMCCALRTVPAVMGRAGRWAARGVVVPGAHEEV